MDVATVTSTIETVTSALWSQFAVIVSGLAPLLMLVGIAFGIIGFILYKFRAGGIAK